MTAADPTPEIPAQFVLSAFAPEPRTLIDILYDTARRYPDAPALDDGTVQLTYAELVSDIEDSVAWLAAREPALGWLFLGLAYTPVLLAMAKCRHLQ